MRVHAMAVWAATLSLSASRVAAQAGSIDIFGTNPATGLTDFGKCQDSVAPGGPAMKISIFARLGGAAANGISGAEFFVLERGPSGNNINVFVPVASGGLGWSVSVFPNPSAVVRGNPFLETGTPPNTDQVALIGWAVDPQTGEGCQKGDADAPPGYVRLYDASISESAMGHPIPPDTYFWVTYGRPPSTDVFPGPFLKLCDPPSYTKVVPFSGQFIVNPSTRTCTVATQSVTLGKVKAMFR